MKSRRQSSGGSSAACAAGEANTHTHSSGGGGCKLERKDVEKNRRLHMKSLCLKLSSLLPPAATHASLLADAAAAASNPNNKVKDDNLLPSRFLAYPWQIQPLAILRPLIALLDARATTD